MTQPRAADDFPAIRARLEELRRERARPRAADDFLRPDAVGDRVTRAPDARWLDAPQVRFALDSPLEGTGCELPIPRSQ